MKMRSSFICTIICFSTFFNCINSYSQCSTPTNISQDKPATQSTNFDPVNYLASKAVNGTSSLSTDFNHTGATELQPWFQIDLGSFYNVTSIHIYHRIGCCGGRIKKFKVFVSASIITNYSDPSSIYTYDVPAGMADGEIVNITGLTSTGRYVRIWADYAMASTTNFIHFAEVIVNGCLPSGPTCSDGIQNGTETGVDCGGSCPTACPMGGTSQWTTVGTSGIYYSNTVHIGKPNTSTGPETPGYSLYVKNGIKSEKVKIELASTGLWGDYVFKNDYRLLPIKEVERFIKSHHHLPDFPSEASIIKEGGFEMGDMMKRQQVGIESLYLYIIELEKKVERMEVMEKRVEELERRMKGKNFISNQ